MATIIVSKNTTGTYANTGYTGVNDTRMRGLSPTTNYASGTFVTTNCWDTSADDCGNALFKFDVSSVGAGTVTNAEIGFWLTNGNQDFIGVDLYQLLVDFVDTEATFQIRKTGTNWNTNNARGAGTDRASTAVATASRSATSGVWMKFTGSSLNAIIEDFLDGTTTNHGFTMEINGYRDDLFTFQDYASSEGTDGQRPYLKFDHTPSGTTLDLTAATLSTSAKTMQNRLTATVTAPTLSTSSKTLQNKLTATLTAAQQSWSAKVIEFVQTGVPVILDLTAATLGIVANIVQNKLTATLTAAQQSWSAKTIQNKLTAALTTAQITLTGMAISARLTVTLTAATMASWSAKALQNRLIVSLTRATLNLQPLAMDFVSDAIVEVVRRLRSKYSHYRKLLKQRRY